MLDQPIFEDVNQIYKIDFDAYLLKRNADSIEKELRADLAKNVSDTNIIEL